MRFDGGLYARSRRWPVRVRIAIVSAMLTAIILIGFAAVVGRLVSNRLHSDFESELRANAAFTASSASVTRLPDGDLDIRGDDIGESDAELRIVFVDGTPFPGTPEGFGRPMPDEVYQTPNGYAVSSALIRDNAFAPALYIQYARPESVVAATIGRLWVFLGAGVAIGTLLSGLAGMAVASRAMRPIAALTATARDIATTRDPSRRVPAPENDDEVAELARTLDQMLRELDAARSETEDTIKRQREFVADASHELRTPLTSILANLELLDAALVGGGPEEDDERAAVASALRSSRRMNRLVGDLLMLARADAGRFGRRRRCDLARIAGEALEEVTPVTDGHTLRADVADAAEVVGNPDELHRMVLNLLENAIRHTPRGSTIDLSVSPQEGTVALSVNDDGPGLPPGMEEQVFERFVRGAGPADRAKRNGTGTGLGLSIVRAVAEAHGGEVEAGGSPTGGARFSVRIPAAEL